MGKTLLNASLISIYINGTITICLENIKTQKNLGAVNTKKNLKPLNMNAPFNLKSLLFFIM